jgi:hypothetical protein
MWGRDRHGRTVEGHRSTHTLDPTAAVSALIGAFAIALGVVAIGTTGLNTADWTSPHEQVLGLHHTPLLAMGEIAFGVLMVLAATWSVVGRLVSAVLTTGLLALGVVVLADVRHSKLHDALGVHHANGWLFVVVGGIGFLAAVAMPMVRTTKTTSVREVPRAADDAGTADEGRRVRTGDTGHRGHRHWLPHRS